MYPAKFKMVVENEEDVAKVLSILGLPSYYFDKNSDISYLFYDKECCGGIPLTYTTGSISGASAKRGRFRRQNCPPTKKTFFCKLRTLRSVNTQEVLSPTTLSMF